MRLMTRWEQSDKVMNLCVMSMFRIICSVPRWFDLNVPIFLLPYLRSFGQLWLNLVPVRIAGWICRWILSIVWSIYVGEESICVRALFIILWEEVWIWCRFILEVLIRRAKPCVLMICLVNWGSWLPFGWDVYPR